MGLCHRLICRWVRRCRLPTTCRGIDVPEGITQSPIVSDRLAELLRELAEQVLRSKIAARMGNLMAQNARALKC